MSFDKSMYRLISSRQAGFTLLEVLVALIILAIGLLGLASLQAVGLRSNHSAQLRTQANILSYDIMDRMRANLRGLDHAGTLQYHNGTAADNDCETNNCDPGQMAAFDLFQWDAALADALPSGRGLVCIDSTPDDITLNNNGTVQDSECDAVGIANPRNAYYAVKIWWCDGQDGDDIDDAPCSAGDEYQLFTTTIRPASN
jgi:type IV pilus assembly protein PilV